MRGRHSASKSNDSIPDVCVVTHPLSAAGENATRSLLDILGSFTSVALVTADLPSDSEIHDRFPVVELTEKGTGNSILVAALRFLLNQFRMCAALRQRPEPVVLFYGATSYILPIAFARLLGKRVFVEPRGDVPLTLRLNWERKVPSLLARLLAGVVRVLERIGFTLAHGIITYTPGMAKQLGLDPSQSHVYPTGARYVRTDQFDIRTSFANRDRRVGFLGRLDEEKNIRELAAVARELPDDVIFSFIGDGGLYEWLETELADEIAAGHVEMRGWVDHDDVPAELNRLRLVVLPSEPTEGLPTAILESFACGTPVYATPVSGVPDVVREGETGFLMNDQNPDAIVETIQNAMGEGTLSKMSDECRRVAETEFSFEAAVGRYRRILRSV